MRHKIEIDGQSTAKEQPQPQENVEPGTEQTAAETAAADATAEDVTALKARVAELEKQVEQEKGQYLRTLADFQNFRRRSEEQGRENAKFANGELILGLLNIVDDFERALAAAEKSQNSEALVSGVALTMRKLQEFLNRNGVQPIEAAGQPFDPNYHEAIARVESEEHPEDTVVDELQKGYMLHDRVLRPARVRVAGN